MQRFYFVQAYYSNANVSSLNKYEILMRHDLVQQFMVNCVVGRCAEQLVHIQGNCAKYLVCRRDCIVVEFQPWMNCLAIVMQPSVKVGGNNAARFFCFLTAFFELFEHFQC